MEGRKMKEAEKLGMVGTMGILRESMKVVECKGKLLAGLTVGLMVPLCVADMAQSFITKQMEARISWDVYLLRRTPSRSESAARIESDMHHEMAKLYAFLAAYLFFVVALSPLPTSAIVYTVSSIYTSDSTTTSSCQKILFTILPRLWKRLFLTSLCAILLIFCYSALFFASFALLSFAWISIAFFLNTHVNMAALNWFGLVSFVVGLVHLRCVWQLGSVVAVLEEGGYGFEAMKRSGSLIQGRRVMAYNLFCGYMGLTLAMDLVFILLVVYGERMGLSRAWRVAIGAATVVGMTAVDLMGLIVKTVFYMACKAYHKESVDKLPYVGDYLPLGQGPFIHDLENTLIV